MANAALIIAEPGSGKSTSIRTLDPSETFIINVSGKSLPFQGSKKMYTPFNSKTKEGNYVIASKAEHILPLLDIISKELPHIKTIVIDDFNYISTFDLMNRSHETGYGKFTIIAKNIYLLITKYRDLRDDIIVFYMNHPEVSESLEGDRRIKAKTVGKLIDNQLVLEGLFTTVLYGRAKRVGKSIDYVFETQTDGVTPSKSPMGMFDSIEIPNDLKLVKDKMVQHEL